MTPKEQAVELYNKMYETGFKPKSVLIRTEQAKECAIIAVNEILKYSSFGLPDMEGVFYDSYWQEVKNELEKL